MSKDVCPKCNGSGEIAIDARTCRYVAAGPVPEDARNISSSTCFECAGTGVVTESTRALAAIPTAGDAK